MNFRGAGICEARFNPTSDQRTNQTLCTIHLFRRLCPSDDASHERTHGAEIRLVRRDFQLASEAALCIRVGRPSMGLTSTYKDYLCLTIQSQETIWRSDFTDICTTTATNSVSVEGFGHVLQ
jgi:hypothetical protein